jgi:hypothetical protein
MFSTPRILNSIFSSPISFLSSVFSNLIYQIMHFLALFIFFLSMLSNPHF